MGVDEWADKRARGWKRSNVLEVLPEDPNGNQGFFTRDSHFVNVLESRAGTPRMSHDSCSGTGTLRTSHVLEPGLPDQSEPTSAEQRSALPSLHRLQDLWLTSLPELLPLASESRCRLSPLYARFGPQSFGSFPLAGSSRSMLNHHARLCRINPHILSRAGSLSSPFVFTRSVHSFVAIGGSARGDSVPIQVSFPSHPPSALCVLNNIPSNDGPRLSNLRRRQVYPFPFHEAPLPLP